MADDLNSELEQLKWKLANSRGDEYKQALARYNQLRGYIQSHPEAAAPRQGQPVQQQPMNGVDRLVNSWPSNMARRQSPLL